LLEDLRQAFPWTTTTITYGSTEAGLVTRMGPRDVLRKPGSVGPPAPTVYVRIEDGELLVRSGHLMSGYFRNPEATAAALRDGWFYTGSWLNATRRAFSASWAGQGRSSGRAASGWRRRRLTPFWRATRPWPMSPSPGFPISIGARLSRL